MNEKANLYFVGSFFTAGANNLQFELPDTEFVEYVVDGRPVKHAAIDLWVDETPITISLYKGGEEELFAYTVFGDGPEPYEVAYGRYFPQIAKFETLRRENKSNVTSSNEMAVKDNADVGILAEDDILYRGTSTELFALCLCSCSSERKSMRFP